MSHFCPVILKDRSMCRIFLIEDFNTVYSIDTILQLKPKMQPLMGRKKAPPGGGGVLPYMGYIAMCRCEGYGFQAVYSRIGYINQSIWV